MGAFFGLAGIFVAACLYLFYALVKLVPEGASARTIRHVPSAYRKRNMR